MKKNEAVPENGKQYQSCTEETGKVQQFGLKKFVYAICSLKQAQLKNTIDLAFVGEIPFNKLDWYFRKTTIKNRLYEKLRLVKTKANFSEIF